MRHLTLILLSMAALALCAPAHAVIGAIDPVPAATLLLPYFEVDGSFESGATTICTVTAMGSTAVVRVVLWTDLGVPTYGFNLLFDADDVRSFNIRDIFNGFAPTATGSVPIPQPDLDRIIAAHAGQPLPSTDLCAGRDFGDGVFRGYITIDSVTSATTFFPGDAGYFLNGGIGVANNDNILWGEYLRVDPANNFASGEPMVHIEADGNDNRIRDAGDYTFYGGLIGGSAQDNREPLASHWLAPFRNDGEGNTSLIYWRDIRQANIARQCFQIVPWYPLPLRQLTLLRSIYFLENPDALEALASVCGRVDVGGFELPTALDSGMILLNLDHDLGTAFVPGAQGYVAVLQDAQGRFSTESAATPISSSIGP